MEIQLKYLIALLDLCVINSATPIELGLWEEMFWINKQAG